MNDDLISRADAIMHFVKASKNYECGMFDLEELTHELWQIPSAQPKQGEWIFHYRDKWMIKAECPKCHLRFQFPPRTIWKCCPMCETRMKGADGKK